MSLSQLCIQKFALAFLLLIGFGCQLFGTMDSVVQEKKLLTGIRMIGHEVLLSIGDSSSRVLPIEQLDGQYKIPFEKTITFEPDAVIGVVQRVMADHSIADLYIVEIEQCTSGEIVHSFVVRQNPDASVMPCRSRALPEDCYNILITLDDSEATDLVAIDTHNATIQEIEAHSGDDYNGTTHNLLNTMPIIILSLGLSLFGMIYFQRKKRILHSDNHLILIGGSLFDKRNMALSYKNNKVDLSNKEAELLTLLHSSVNAPVEREVILQRVWGDEGDYVGRTLDVFISKLRKKLEPDSSVKIVNIRGVGYKLVMNAQI